MQCEVTDAQAAQYRAQGFLQYPGFLSKEEVAELKQAVVETATAMGRRKLAEGGAEWDVKEEGDYYDRVFTQRVNLWRLSPTVKRYMLAPELGRMLCRLAGVTGFRMWHDQTLIKEPFANPTAWHLDNPYWSYSSRDSIAIWIALEDATPLNGCMCFLPGSHKLARFETVNIGQEMAGLFKMYPEMGKIDPVAAPMKAGDCSFHNGLTAHGAGGNMTRGRRIAMTAGYMPVGSTFNGRRNVLPERVMKVLKVGDELRDDEWNPVVYEEKAGAVVTLLGKH